VWSIDPGGTLPAHGNWWRIVRLSSRQPKLDSDGRIREARKAIAHR
jgi:hypothetical protein